MKGTVYLVGAGPGAPDLLTLRAARVLRDADIVFYDALVHSDTLALAERAEQILVGKRCGRHSTAQRFINKRLVDAARGHRVVVRLKGGDPTLFGRAQEEIAALREANVPVEIIPGVTAALAAAAELGVSLTQRGLARSVALATPRAAEGAAPSGWLDAVLAADTAVLYMAARDAARVKAELLAHGLPASRPVAVVESASSPARKIFAGRLAELDRLAAQCADGPAVLLVGEVLAAAAREGLLPDLAAPAKPLAARRR
ncbi:MAG TPA: uroporphyrinogen-III C-methyltransferase [Burkholderiales bacterium]|nr:uroporphyrinogen-III C-methyltransferase [Burkholderiales bacterium]